MPQEYLSGGLPILIFPTQAESFTQDFLHEGVLLKEEEEAP